MIKDVLFDSGDTLVRPKAGEWFPKQHFVDAFRARGVTDANMDRFREALDVGLRYLDEHHALAVTEDIERDQFRTAYELILRALGISGPTEELIADILRPFDEDVGMEPFPDTEPALRRLHRAGLRLGGRLGQLALAGSEVPRHGPPRLLRRLRHLGPRRKQQAV